MPVNAKNQHRIESTPVAASTRGTPVGISMNAGKEMTEEEKLAAMFSANNEAWKQDQSLMAGKPVIRSTYNKSAAVPDKPLPPGYICHRCGEKGHWIQACPTNNDPTFDGRPKFRRTTGIPRSMLKVIDKPTEVDENGKIDVSKLPAGVMYTANGEWVIAEPDKVAWQKFQDKQNASAEKAKEASADNEELRKLGLECPIDRRAFVDPVKTPCCGKTYCRDCIENALLDSDLTCPTCGEQVLLDNLETDEETVTKIKQYEDEKKAEKSRKDKETSKSPVAAGSPKAGSPKAEDAKSPAAANVPEIKVDGTISTSTTPNSKKRQATEELENNRKPANPAEAKRPTSKQGTSIPTGPRAGTSQPPTQIANNPLDFAKQMEAMASGMPNMRNGVPAMMNPMMGMGMGMPGMPMMPGMMPGFNPMMGGDFGMNGMNGMGGMGGFGGGMQNGGWQGQQQGWGGRNGTPNGAGNDAYFRQPVNPHRQQGRQKRQRSVDYKQM